MKTWYQLARSASEQDLAKRIEHAAETDGALNGRR
jgi:hypothetical protein